jgi:ubiquinone/menaquinone biosynthesis C-methylase UbiE
MKDNFSNQSNQYAKFRPVYPQKLYEFLISVLKNKYPNGLGAAWDCGTGNGQVAQELSKYFKKVYATDISAKQIEHAVQKENIIYMVESAEETTFADSCFDLVTVAQAIHWFEFEKFYSEVRRVSKPGSILAVIGYGLLSVDEKTDKVISEFYKKIIRSYWDKERKYIDELYKTIPFPFEEIRTPELSIDGEWNVQQMIGYLETWSAVQHYIKQNQKNPVDLIYPDLLATWPEGEIKQVKFPVLLRVGIV